ncbi:hypothetical protein [Noviherbaspirillum galbum]|uniref:Uncharacterized protein n=1 Tax=Noviherbaspirillum galbum TaxID=2709383 RepID=A0A6B3SFN5_9BURK|nr:hypothetical protein [Noviherbaspirillum galbum]NEX59631.1 hypothetical protein [Noviherbaspirillum galbum]
MPTIRRTTKEVQVDDMLYIFDVVQVADAFEACVAATDVAHCELDHPPATKRPLAADDMESAEGKES